MGLFDKKQRPLTEDELEAVYSYFISENKQYDFDAMPGHCPLVRIDERLACILDRFLDDCPTYKGDISKEVNYLNTEQYEQFMYAMTPGNDVEFEKFLRFNKGIVEEDLTTNITLVVKNSKKAKNISHIFEGEGEIVYPRYTRFRVKKHTSTKNNVFIFMEEL